jgi:Tfp pilus assembly protein FimV
MIFSGVHMSFSVGLPNAAGITIGGKSAATVRALSDATADAAAQALSTKESDGKQVRTGPLGLDKTAVTEEPANDNTSIAVKVLLKRLKELQEQLRQQQQQLAAAQSAAYSTPEAKMTAVSAIQGQIAETNGAILQVSASLIKEVTKGASTGSMVNTTA